MQATVTRKTGNWLNPGRTLWGGVALLLVLSLLLGACQQQAQPTSSAPPVSQEATPVVADTPTPAPAGPVTVEIPINLDGADHLGSLEFSLAYDADALEFLSVEQGDLSDNALLDYSVTGPGQVWVGMVDANGIQGTGAVAVASFRVSSEGPAQSELSLRDVKAYHAESLLDLVVETGAGSFTAMDSTYTSPSIGFAN